MPECNSSSKNAVENKLLSIESIFKWKPVIYEENLQEIFFECEPQSEHQFNFYNFILQLINCINAYNEENDDSALKILDELEVSADTFNEDGDGGFFKKIRNAYHHVIYASKSFLLIRKDKDPEAAEIVEKIKPYDEMDKYNKAAILAMKSAVFALCSNEDTQKAFASIEKALKLDEHGLWYFLKGLYFRKIRRMTNPFESPSLCEKELFEKAYEKEPSNVVFKLHLADVYRETYKHASQRSDLCTHFLPKDASLNENLKTNIDRKIQQAAQYYKDAANEYPNCPYVMFRAAEGLAKLPENLNDINLAKKLTEDGLKLSPDNVCGNLVQAFLYEKFDKNIKEARKHLSKCQEKCIFEAEMNQIRILSSTKAEKFNGIEALQLLLDKYQEKARKAILYSQMVSYYLFVNYELIKANENATTFYKLGTGSSCMNIHRSCFIGTTEPFSLIDVLLDEIKYVMDGHRTPVDLKKSCEKFVQFVNFQNIPIMKGFPQNFRQQILDGKPMTVNPKMCEKPFKNAGQTNKRGNNTKKDDFRNEQRSQSTSGRPNPSNKVNSSTRQNNQASTGIEVVPSLMELNVSKPVPKKLEKPLKNETPPEPVVEKHLEKRPEDNENDSSSDSKLEKAVRKVLQGIKKNKSQPNDDDSNSLAELLKLMGLGNEKSTRRKKHYSDSDTDSDYKRRKDRRRDRSRRRRRRSRSDSDDSDRHGRRHRRHKRYSSDSDDSSRSVHRGHRKYRHDRDYSPRDRHRRRHYSSDDDRSSYRRDVTASPERRRRRKDSRDRSPSYDRRQRRRSPKKSVPSRRRSISPTKQRQDRKHSVSSGGSRDGSPSSNKYSRCSSPKKESLPYEKKSRRRSASRDERDSRRSNKTTKPNKERSSEVDEKESKRDQNSSPGRHRSISPKKRRQRRTNSVSSRGSRDRSSSFDKHSKRGSPKRDSLHEKKSRRRTSRDNRISRRQNKPSKEKKEHTSEVDERESKHDRSSVRGRSGDESDS